MTAIDPMPDRSSQKPRPKPVRADARERSYDPILSALVDDAAARAPISCSQCGSGMPKDAVLCTRCGYNSETGRAAKVRVEKAPKVKGEKRAAAGPGVNPVLAGVVLAVVLVGLAGASIAAPPVFLALWLVTGLLGLGQWIFGIVTAFQEQRVGAAWCGILAFLGLPLLYFLAYCLFLTDRAMLKSITACTLLGSVLQIAVMLSLASTA